MFFIVSIQQAQQAKSDYSLIAVWIILTTDKELLAEVKQKLVGRPNKAGKQSREIILKLFYGKHMDLPCV